MSWGDLGAYGLSLAAGAGLGAVYFAILAQTVRLHVAGASASRIVPLYVLRIGAAVAAFWVIAQYGAMPLLLSLAGFVLARAGARAWTGM
jgi:F1F0 ATPase subunit 2